MKSDIIYKIIQIIISIIIVFISIPIWDKLEEKNIFTQNIMKSNSSELLAFEDNKANPYSIKKYIINNTNDFVTTGSLYIKYDKTSEIKSEYLQISINDNIINLDYLFEKEDEEYKYFLLSKYNLLPNEKRTYTFVLDIKKQNYIDAYNKNIKYKIAIEEDSK